MSPEISALNNRPVIIGGGAAGLMTALQMAPEPVLLLSKAPLGAEASSLWAQGGLAAAMGGDDAPALHLADTLAAGVGLCDEAVANRIVHAAPAAVEHLARLGVAFDRRPDGGWRLGLEAAHGRNRIVHATGDGTGREIMRALIAAVRRCPSVTLLDSPWPIDQIWRANQADEEVHVPIDLNAGGVSLEIRRWEDDVVFHRLDPAIYTFRTTLEAGHALALAAEAALAAGQEFDCVAALHELLTDGVIIGFTL